MILPNISNYDLTNNSYKTSFILTINNNYYTLMYHIRMTNTLLQADLSTAEAIAFPCVAAHFFEYIRFTISSTNEYTDRIRYNSNNNETIEWISQLHRSDVLNTRYYMVRKIKVQIG